MRRSPVGLLEIADLRVLEDAFRLACRGKRRSPEVIAFARNLDSNLAAMRQQILDGEFEIGKFESFVIHDPKRRVIHAPGFPERVLHHAVMRVVGPVLDRTLIDDTYACRVGRGAIAAAKRVQTLARSSAWYVKVDIAKYFDSIDHARLKALLRRRLKSSGVLALLDRVVDSHSTLPGKGLPIGSLTSQHFANAYLSSFDRRIAEDPRCRGFVRYMDDSVWFTANREYARDTLAAAREFVHRELSLAIKPDARVQRTSHGIPFCGFRVKPYALLLSRRRRKRYSQARRGLEAQYERGEIDALTLLSRSSAVLAITAHADARAWRRGELARRGTIDA